MDILSTLRQTFLDWSSMRAAFGELLTVGLPNTLKLAVSAAVLGAVLGMFLALAGLSRSRWLRWPARVYTDVFRGLPAVVTILLIGLGLAPVETKLWGSDAYPLGILALALITAAYVGEILRAGIQSVDAGQYEAARALGLGKRAAMWSVVIPQGVRQVLPALVNQFIALVQQSSLVYFLGLTADQRDIFRIGQDAAANTGNESALLLAGLFYLALTVPLTHVVNHIDRRLRTGPRLPQAEADTEDAGDVGPTTAPIPNPAGERT